MPRGSWAKALAEPVLRQVAVHGVSQDCSTCVLLVTAACPRCTSAPHLLPPPLPFLQDPTEGELWDRLVAGSRVCSGLLAPGVVAGGSHWPSAGTSQAAREDGR